MATLGFALMMHKYIEPISHLFKTLIVLHRIYTVSKTTVCFEWISTLAILEIFIALQTPKLRSYPKLLSGVSFSFRCMVVERRKAVVVQ